MIPVPGSPRKDYTPPIVGVALGYLGGLLLLIGVFAAYVSFGLGSFSGGLSISLLGTAALVSLGLLTSILTLVSSSMLYNRPEEHFVWGFLILFFGIIGFGPWNYFGLYAIGSVLTVIGGFYGLAFQPHEASGMTPRPDPTPASFLKNCIHCGANIPIAAETCSSCGKPQKRA